MPLLKSNRENTGNRNASARLRRSRLNSVHSLDACTIIFCMAATTIYLDDGYERLIKIGRALPCFEVTRGAHCRQPAVAHEAEPVAIFSLIQIMGGDKNRSAMLGHVTDHLPDLAAGNRIDAGRGLVEKK